MTTTPVSDVAGRVAESTEPVANFPAVIQGI